QSFSLPKHRFPFLFQGGVITVSRIEVFGIPNDRSKDAAPPELKLTLSGPPDTPALGALENAAKLGDLVHKVVKDVGIEVGNLGETGKEADWTFKVLKADVPVSLDRLEDILVLLHYSVVMPK